MKPGFTFKNETMTLTSLCYRESGKRNLVLLIRHSDGMFITARDISKDLSGDFSWSWGSYFIELSDSVTDFNKRASTL